jgi:hypothetical protein
VIVACTSKLNTTEVNEGEAYVALLGTKLALSLASKPLYLERDSIILLCMLLPPRYYFRLEN